jgi:hypothetical protein
MRNHTVNNLKPMYCMNHKILERTRVKIYSMISKIKLLVTFIRNFNNKLYLKTRRLIRLMIAILMIQNIIIKIDTKFKKRKSIKFSEKFKTYLMLKS